MSLPQRALLFSLLSGLQTWGEMHAKGQSRWLAVLQRRGRKKAHWGPVGGKQKDNSFGARLWHEKDPWDCREESSTWSPPSLGKSNDLVEVIELERGRAGIRSKFNGSLSLEKSRLGKKSCVSNFRCVRITSRVCWSTEFWAPSQSIWFCRFWGIAFLESSQAMLLLVLHYLEPYFEDYCSMGSLTARYILLILIGHCHVPNFLRWACLRNYSKGNDQCILGAGVWSVYTFSDFSSLLHPCMPPPPYPHPLPAFPSFLVKEDFCLMVNSQVLETTKQRN